MNTNMNSHELMAIQEGHVGMSIANYLNVALKEMTMKQLAIKMGHRDTGIIYRRLKQSDPDFGFMIEIMEAFGSISLIEYLPEHVKGALTHHARVKHPEWFSVEDPQILGESNENEYRKNMLQLMRELIETQKELIEILKSKQNAL